MTESLFAIGNGYIGMRANATEGREAHSHGTYLNGFHETWDIKHAEDAFAFAKTGQTTVNVPDAKLMKLYVDDEPLLLATADLDQYERVLDFRNGVSSSGCRVAHPGRQADPGPVGASGQLPSPPPGDDAARVHDARRRRHPWSCRRSC